MAISGLADNLGIANVNSASIRGTAKSAMLTGHDTRPHNLLLFFGAVRCWRGGDPPWDRPAARPNRTGESLDCILLPWRGFATAPIARAATRRPPAQGIVKPQAARLSRRPSVSHGPAGSS